MWADSGYTGMLVDFARTVLHLALTVVKRTDPLRGFRVLPRRWVVEEGFAQAKELCGLDEHQVRRWDSWHRWVTLAMAALAVLAVAAAIEGRSAPLEGMIPLTVSEVRRLLMLLAFVTVVDIAHRLAWSHWRRRHQARSRDCHHRRQRTNTR